MITKSSQSFDTYKSYTSTNKIDNNVCLHSYEHDNFSLWTQQRKESAMCTGVFTQIAFFESPFKTMYNAILFKLETSLLFFW